jgi:hypothetical protein
MQAMNADINLIMLCQAGLEWFPTWLQLESCHAAFSNGVLIFAAAQTGVTIYHVVK